jgi:hypothetical protein
MAIAAGQAHRSAPVPGLATREGDVDPHLLASKDNHQVTVDIGQPALRDCPGRPASVPLEHRAAGHAVNTVNEPRLQFRPPLTKQLRSSACFVEHVPFHSPMTPSAVRAPGLPYGTAWTALTTWHSEASPGKPARATNRANSGPFI